MKSVMTALYLTTGLALAQMFPRGTFKIGPTVAFGPYRMSTSVDTGSDLVPTNTFNADEPIHFFLTSTGSVPHQLDIFGGNWVYKASLQDTNGNVIEPSLNLVGINKNVTLEYAKQRIDPNFPSVFSVWGVKTVITKIPGQMVFPYIFIPDRFYSLSNGTYTLTLWLRSALVETNAVRVIESEPLVLKIVKHR